MLSQDEKVAQFVDAINKNAEAMCKKIEKETLRHYTAEAEKLEKEAKSRAESKIKQAQLEILAAFNKAMATHKSALRLSLIEKRQALTGDMFKSAAAEITMFTLTDAYNDFLIKSIKKISAYISGKMIIYASKDHIQRVTDAAKAVGVDFAVVSDSAICLGGIKCCGERGEKVFDDTLDQRLSEQREWFLEHSGLIIED